MLYKNPTQNPPQKAWIPKLFKEKQRNECILFCLYSWRHMNVKYWRLQPAFLKKKERIKSRPLKEDRKYILQMEYTWFRKSFFFLLNSFLVNFCYISHHTTGTILHIIYKYVSSNIGKNFPYRKLLYVYLSWFLRILYSFAMTGFWQKDFVSCKLHGI